jgi:hypothetical protein
MIFDIRILSDIEKSSILYISMQLPMVFVTRSVHADISPMSSILMVPHW